MNNISEMLLNIIFRKYVSASQGLNPIQDGGDGGRGGQKGPPPTIFSPVTSTNVGLSPQNFLTFSFNPFPRLV